MMESGTENKMVDQKCKIVFYNLLKSTCRKERKRAFTSLNFNSSNFKFSFYKMIPLGILFENCFVIFQQGR